MALGRDGDGHVRLGASRKPRRTRARMGQRSRRTLKFDKCGLKVSQRSGVQEFFVKMSVLGIEQIFQLESPQRFVSPQ